MDSPAWISRFFIGLMLCLPILSLRFDLMAGHKKCLKDDSPGGIISKGSVWASKHEIISSSIVIRDSKNHLLYQREGFDNASFSFSTEDYDIADICFEAKMKHPNQPPESVEIFLDIKQGADAKPFDFLPNAENLKPVEAELRRLEAITEEIVSSFVHMHNKSSHMRVTNESTHTRVLYFSLLSMITLIGFACWQVLYLRRYFKSKKLIE